MANAPSLKRALSRAGIAVLVVLLAFAVTGGIWYLLFITKIDDGVDAAEARVELQAVLAEHEPAKPYYMLLIGSDSREGVRGSDAKWAGKAKNGKDGLADVMILARVDEAASKVTLLTVPRDTPWRSKDGSWGKLNAVYHDEGIAGLVSAVSEIAGVPIAHYAEIHMSGFMELVDSLGGIDVEVPHEIDYHEALTNEKIHIDAGLQHLNGAEAETFARERTSYADEAQDMNRQSNVRAVVKAIYNRIKALPVWSLPGAISACAKCVSTDMSPFELIEVASALGGDPKVYSGTAPYDGDVNPYADGQWLCYVDKQGWSRVMSVVEAGKNPGKVRYEGDRIRVAGEKLNDTYRRP